MIKASHSTFAVKSHEKCPSDRLLANLLHERLSDADQAVLIAHLDQCDSCRTRLEDAAGDGDIWTAATGSLRVEPVGGPELNRVTAALRSAAQPTRSAQHSALTPEAIDFLEPCETSGRLGRLDRYEIIELLGYGGMGFVFKAYEPSLSRVVALKVVAAPCAQGAKARERFRREARAAAAVRSDHVVAVHEVEDSARIPYLAMEYIDGTSLDDYLRGESQRTWREIARIGAEIADGLQAAHSVGVVHRDIKPANILLERETGRVKITDFGLARTIDDAGLTQKGCVTGTPEYMAPEQAAGEAAGPAADLFSLGSVLYAMCAGQPPFAADTTMAVLRRTLEDDPAAIQQSRADLPASLVEVITRLLQKEPTARYEHASDVAAALRAVAGQATVSPATKQNAKRRFVGWMAFATLLLVGAGLAVGEFSGILNGDDGKSGLQVSQQGSDEGSAAGAFVALKDDMADEDEKKDDPVVPPARQQPAGVEQPARIQIVTPDSLMREAARLKKDLIPETISPHLARKLDGHTGPVKGVAFSPDGRWAVSCSGWPAGDRTIRLWEVDSGKEVRQFDMAELPLNPEKSGPREAPGEVMCVAFTPDGKHAVAGLSGGAIGLWDVGTGKLVRHFDGHDGTVYGVAVSPTGDRILSASRDSTARLWEVASGDELLRIPNSSGWMRCVAFAPDGKRALIGTYDNKMHLWDLVNAAKVEEVKFKNWVWDVAFSPDGSRAAAVAGNIVGIWDLDKPNQVLEIRHPVGATCVAYSPDGTRLLTGGYDMTVRLWDATSGELLETFEGHRGWVWSVAFSPDGRSALSAGGGRHTANQGTNAGIDFSLRLWKMPKRETRIIDPG